MEPAGKADRFLNNALVNKLFKSQVMWNSRHNKVVPNMGDLATRNIQRGRDHGMSDYNSYRKYFNMVDLTNLDIKSCITECCNNYDRM